MRNLIVVNLVKILVACIVQSECLNIKIIKCIGGDGFAIPLLNHLRYLCMHMKDESIAMVALDNNNIATPLLLFIMHVSLETIAN